MFIECKRMWLSYTALSMFIILIGCGDDAPTPADPGPLPPDGFVMIPAGTFIMGSPSNESGRSSNEIQHEVTLTTAFVMSETEVTNQQYANMAQWAYENGYCTATSTHLHDAIWNSNIILLFMEDDACEISFSNGVFIVDAGKENHPVQFVRWYGAAAYCDWLSLQEGLVRAYDHSTWQCNNHDPYRAQGYRLPTEAEWEYACRAGSTTAFANGVFAGASCSDPVLNAIGWYCGNAGDWTQPVGSLNPNNWGLYDMHGNIWEWCNDWYGVYSGDVTDPIGQVEPWGHQVIRGGATYDVAQYCRSADRNHTAGDAPFRAGFRPVKSSR